MNKFISYPSIGQFRSTVKNVSHSAAYAGEDGEGNPIMDYNKPKPTLTFTGTVKLHGTNAGVCYDTESGELWAQSRKNVITPEKDNAGFAFFVETNKEIFELLLGTYATLHPAAKIVALFGEWCGGNIQKGVGICELEKMFVTFGCKIIDDNDNVEWVQLLFCDKEENDHRVFSINQFPTYTVDIDFNIPDKVVNKLTEITESVEAECPVAKTFGVSGIGEGVVWTCGEHKFKVKGEKHSATKVKKLASVDIEKLESIEKFVEYVVTENRLNQAIEQVFTIEGEEIDIKKMGAFLKWIMSDIIKEESDTMAENNLEPKDVGKYVNGKAKAWFMEKWEMMG